MQFADIANVTPTIYFLTPDQNRPSGGIRVIYRHVDILNSAGIRSFVLHRHRGFRCTWFEHQTAVTDLAATPICRGDLLVIPEIDVDVLASLPQGARHIIFNQNIHQTWERGAARATHHYINSPDLAAVITVSEHSEQVLRYAFSHVPIYRIHLGVDPELFSLSEFPASQRIGYMPRKGAGDSEAVFEILRARGLLEGWELVPMHNLKHDEVGKQLRTTKIFLSFTYQEGFGLPPAEAMACGNYVVGFHGFGGREFFRREFSAPVPTGDIMGFARAVEETFAEERVDPSWCAERGKQASAFILANYSIARERADVLGVYSAILNGPDQCRSTKAVTRTGAPIAS